MSLARDRVRDYFRGRTTRILAIVVLLLLGVYLGLRVTLAMFSPSSQPPATATVLPVAAVADTPTQAPPSATSTPVPSATSTPVPSATAAPTRTPTRVPSATPTAVPTSTFKNSFDFHPVAVMIDNNSAARPQSGLNKADVVIEAVVEGGITRYMAIFANQDCDVVGPVRSARHYFVYWAAEFNAIFAHAGASPQGFDALSATGISDMDDNFGGGFFWRSEDRDAPHNLYTSTSKLREMEPDTSGGTLSSLAFKDDKPATRDVVKHLIITYPGGYYVSYAYEPQDNAYWRAVEGNPAVDAYLAAQYEPKNVAILIVENYDIPDDDKGRQEYQLTGGGVAYYFVDGRMVKGAWYRDDVMGPTSFVDDAGQPMQFNRGQTWIQMVPSTAEIETE